MPPYKKPSVDEILKKYGSKLEGQIQTTKLGAAKSSMEYIKFKGEMVPELKGYERLCRSVGNVIKVKVSEKDKEKIKKYLDLAHVDVTPTQALSLSIVSFLTVFLIGLFASVAVAFIKGGIADFPLLLFFMMLIVSVFLFYYLNSYPQRLANKWRLKASSQMVPAILYVVVYMRHTPNLERAIEFASEHLQFPLALDFKKVFYNVSVGKFSTIKESLDHYLESWRGYSNEFIESFHLIESSLFEPDKNRRIATLEKSLQVVLDGVYEKMLNFTHNVKSPLTNVYMLAVMLPILGIALIPLASAMLQGMLKAIHIFILYNLLIPFTAFFMMDKILEMRPGGYGETTLLEKNPLYKEYQNKGPHFTAFLICLPLLIIGLLPLLFQFTAFPDMVGLQSDYTYAELGLGFFGDGYLFDFEETDTGIKGPFGAGALFLSLFIPLSIMLFFSMAYKDRTKNLIKERRKTRQLEKEFNNSLFQLGNRLGNGVPPELVFGKMAESSKGLVSFEFFRRVNYNIRQMGMSVEKAIFDSRRGAIIFYPSDLIATSMRVLIESSKKGLKIAAVSLMSISEYVKNIHKITTRLKDMLAEILSDMKSNMTFLAPLLSGIVVGLALMITSIISKLELSALTGDTISGMGNIEALTSIFQKIYIIPPYYLQIAIGIYLIQIVFILTGTLVTVDSGEDKLERMNQIGSNLKKGIGLYFVVSLVATLALFVLSTVVLGNLSG